MENSDPTYGLPHVIIPNMQTFAAKKSRLLAAGLSQLQLISDFDKTLTPMKANGRSAVTTYGITRMICIQYQHYFLICW